MKVIKKVFLDKLPRGGKCIPKNKINWKESVGQKVKFIYNDIYGEIEILEYLGERRLLVKYKDNEVNTATNTLISCEIGNIIGVKSREYKFKTNQIIDNAGSGKLKILEQLRLPHGNRTGKGYKYKCMKCGNISYILENSLTHKQGCAVCAGKKVLIGYNDIWTTAPELAKLLTNPEDGYKYTKGSQKKLSFTCPDCGRKNSISIHNVSEHVFSCPYCSDGISRPEKFMLSVLNQLDINYIKEYSPKFANRKRYDFYIPSLKCIIESHGMQHYKGGFDSYGEMTRTLPQEQENDKLKEDLAKKNGIEYYIVIDCRESDLKFLKNNILHSKLAELFDLSQINWIQVNEDMATNLMRKVWDLYEKGVTINAIKHELKLSEKRIKRYLIQGANITNYTPNKKKPVICLTINKIFPSVKEGAEYFRLSASDICSCCKKKKKSAGKHPITGEPLIWMYYIEYKKLSFEQVLEKSKYKVNKCTPVRCTTTNIIFPSMKEAIIYANIKSTANIVACCKGRNKFAGKLPNGIKLSWEYYIEKKDYSL